jgi:transposase-like protein
MLGITYKSAWFMAYRIGHTMNQNPFTDKLSGIDKTDETYIGGKHDGTTGTHSENKSPVLTLLQRGGETRSFHVTRVTGKKNLTAIINENVSPDAQVMTDMFHGYIGLDKQVAAHDTVNHSTREYARGEAYVNTAEGYFSLLKRGIVGVYHHVGKQHLHRYLAEFDFRYNAREKERYC